MSNYRERIDQLRLQAAWLPDGATKVELLEEAVRLADQHADTSLGFDLRRDLIIAAFDAGRQEHELVAFAWMLSQCDRDPERFPEREILWFYKWVVSTTIRYPQVPLAQIEQMIDDMEVRFRRTGSTLRAIHTERWHLHLHRGDREAASQAYEAVCAAPRDWLSDCEACEHAHRVHYRIFLGELELALELARPILDGRQECAHVPHRSLADLLIPLLQLGRVAEADGHQRRGYRLIATNPDKFAYCFGDHLAFLALTGRLSRAVKLLEKHLPALLQAVMPSDLFYFFVDSSLVLDRLIETGTPTMRVRLPRTFPLFKPRGPYDLAELSAWFKNRAGEIADQFDERNGTDAFRRRMHERTELKRLAVGSE